MRFQLSLFTLLISAATVPFCMAQEATAPVIPLAENQLRRGDARVFPFKEGKRFMPLVIRSAEKAEGRFTDDFMATLTESVDWDKQYVLVFAWSGPMDDRLTFEVDDSTPPQATFGYLRGRLRAGSDFNHVYVLRNDVKWHFKELGRRFEGLRAKPAK